jgi:hypothetical protein
MKANGTSKSYQNGNLRIMIYFAKFLGPSVDLYIINKKEHILALLDTKIKDSVEVRTKDGLEHRTIICNVSSILLDGFVIANKKRIRKSKYHQTLTG